MPKVLAKSVSIRKDDGTPVHYKAGDIPPRDHAKMITNPAAWADEEKPKRRKVDPYNGGDYGTGPFQDREDAQLLALAHAYNISVETRDEAVAALEAEGVSDSDDAKHPQRPKSSDTNVSE